MFFNFSQDSSNKGSKYVSFALTLLTIALLCATPVSAESVSYTTFHTPRFILHIDGANEVKHTEKINVRVVATQAITALNNTYDELSRVFQIKPEKKVVLRFLSAREFKRQTGAPDWTSAMYFRDEITIPLTRKAVEKEELGRALRHEYVHAFIAQLSNYRCPAWLDEGVAQILEGPANPLLGPALRRWIVHNDAIPLHMLENGFTTLENEIVPAAYAQSLFATRKLIHRHGFPALVDYLKNLKAGLSQEKSFKIAFGEEQEDFQKSLTPQIKRWAGAGQIDP